MKTKINSAKVISIIFTIFITFSKTFSQSYSLDDPVFVPLYNLNYNIDDIDTRDYFWDVSEINTNNRLDIVCGLNQIKNATTHNYIDANWYKNQYNDNFNEYNSSTKFIHQEGYQINLTYITGLVFAKIHSSSDRRDLIVSKTDTLYVFKNTSGSISTTAFQQFYFPCTVETSGKFTTDDAEDIAVLRNDSIFIFQGLGTNDKIDSIPVYKMSGAAGSNVKFILAQISSKIEPYATINGTTSNKDEIVMRQGSTIIIFFNDNNNGISSSSFIEGFSSDVDFKIADVNNDGYNDLVTTSYIQGIKIYLNTSGSIDTNSDYTNESIFLNPKSIDVADFDKDGWNDLVVATLDSIKIFLNTKQTELFSQNLSYGFPYDFNEGFFPLFGNKLVVKDLQNKGGLSLIYSGFTAVNFESSPYPSNIEWMYRFNPTTIDANPAPVYLFKTTTWVNGVLKPKLLMFNRGDRDFAKYRIYKRGTHTNWNYALIDSTTSDNYIDTIEVLDTTSYQANIPAPNLFYYVVAEDNSYKLSINSDTIKFTDIICPTCPTEPYEGGGDSDNRPDLTRNQFRFDLTNFPNPFNPVTKIIFTLSKEENVKITIYNSAGQEIKVLINEIKSPGSYETEFNGNNLSSGIYFYRIESGRFIQTNKMLLLK